MMRGPCGGRAIDLEASAAWAIVASEGLAAARPLLQRGQVPLDTRPTPPSPGRRSTRRASGSTGSDRGAWGDHWSSRLLADQLGISHSTVVRVWAEHDGEPWQTEAFRFSSDPELEARVRDVVGLSLEPSAQAIVLGVDEKSQIQALERTQPSRPHPGRCPPATSAWSSDSPGPVAGVADDRLGGGAAGLSTPQEVTPVKRSWTAVRPPVPRRCRAAGCRERPRAPWSSKCPGQGPYGGRGKS